MLDPCLSEPCFFGGTCEKLSGVMYRCLCQPGYEGNNCEIENNPCDSFPCQNFGICKKLSPLDYECDCTSTESFTGEHCEYGPVNVAALVTGVSLASLLLLSAIFGYLVYLKRTSNDKIVKQEKEVEKQEKVNEKVATAEAKMLKKREKGMGKLIEAERKAYFQMTEDAQMQFKRDRRAQLSKQNALESKNGIILTI